MEQIAENVYVEPSYEGVNVGAIVTNQGIIAIDSPSYPRQAREWAMRLHTLSPRPVLFVILTDYHGDRVLNARWLNAPIIAQQVTADKLASYDKRYPAHLLDNLASRNPQRGRELGNGPIEKAAMSFSNDLHILKGGIQLRLLTAPGPTSGNIWVYLPTKGILFAGDTVTAGYHPLLLEGTSQLWLETLQRLQTWSEPLQTIVPGRGSFTHQETISPMSAYLGQMRECVEKHIAEGKVKEGTAVYIPEFLAMFPQNGLPDDWLRQQIKQSLDHVYDEIQLGRNRR
jgi:glyoxylase-like metal-dependent hydrolase (beta-lactamase superfamily II)